MYRGILKPSGSKLRYPLQSVTKSKEEKSLWLWRRRMRRERTAAERERKGGHGRREMGGF
ncbi:hypothetical protein CsSME_00004686 [Camellia sinensis var. sinensis]